MPIETVRRHHEQRRCGLEISQSCHIRDHRYELQSTSSFVCFSLLQSTTSPSLFIYCIPSIILMQAKRLSEICFTSSKIEFPLISKSSLRGLSRQRLKRSCGLLLSGIHASTKVSISLRLSDCRSCSIFSMCLVPA